MMDFIKPTIPKIILLLLLLSLSFIPNFTIPNLLGSCYDCPTYYGFILPFYNDAGDYGPGGKFVESSFSIGYFIINALLLYILSSTIVLIANKFRK